MTKKEIREMKVTPEMKDALREVAETQDRFWDALHNLEAETEMSFDANCDFIDYTNPSDEDVRQVCENCTTDETGEEDGDAEE